MCPGRNLVLLLSAAMIAAILDMGRIALDHPRQLASAGPLPGTLNHFRLRFAVKAGM